MVLLVSLYLVVAILVAYGQVIQFDFVGYDDELYVTENIHVQEGVTYSGIKWAFTTSHAGNWHPLTWLSHMLDYNLYGVNPAGHHWTNIGFHIANTLLLFYILYVTTGALWRSAFVAALFALHPLHVESVAWVSERKDVLSTFLGLLMILAYGVYVKNPGLKKYVLVIIFLSLGLMAKPMLVTFPFVLLLLDYWPLRRFQFGNPPISESVGESHFGFQGLLRLILEKIPLFIPVVISCMLTFLAQKSQGAITALDAIPFKRRAANALVSYIRYVFKAVWPGKLAVFYPHPGNTLEVWRICGAGLLILIATFLSIRSLKKYPYIFVGLFIYFGTLIPVIGLVQVGGQAMADRYTYIPLIGVFIIIAWGFSDLSVKWRYRKIILSVSALIVLSGFTAKTFFQTSHWKNGVTLFEHAVKVTKNNYKAQNNLGTALAFADIDQAISHYKAALSMKPDYAVALYNLGNVFIKKGEVDEAIEQYQKALHIKPDYVEVLNNLGNAFFNKKDYDKALIYFTRADKINPGQIDAKNNLANVWFVQGKTDEAISQYRDIVKTYPEDADAHYNLAYMLSVQGMIDEAVPHYKESLRINPKYSKAHYNLGNILFNQGKTKQAFIHFAEAIKFKPDYAPAYNKIGLILFQQGKFKKAEVFFLKALQMDPDHYEARKNLGLLPGKKKSNKP
jgi:protein O-mannosyl-transferase